MSSVALSPIPQPFTDQQTFQTFFNDPGNEFAIATCRNAAQAPGVSHNPIYISGPAGTGKTHLIRATAGLLEKTSVKKLSLK